MVHPYQLFGEEVFPGSSFIYTVPTVEPCSFIVRTITWSISTSAGDSGNVTFNGVAVIPFFTDSPTVAPAGGVINCYIPVHSADTIEAFAPIGSPLFIGVYGDWWAPNNDSS